jgi:uroporphyrinogen decarboxylase
MRQAGRYMPEYRAIRANHAILEMCKRPEIAAEVTLQPVEALGVDAAIIFADLLLPAEPMGLKLEFVAGEGPHIHNPVRTSADVAQLSSNHTADLGYVAEAIRIVKRNLDGKVPVVGFVGAPFTLASYINEGGASRYSTPSASCMRARPVDELKEARGVLGAYARSWEAGAAAIQVFDSWAGALSPTDYEQYVLPHSRALIRAIQKTQVPVIHFATGVGAFYPTLQKAGGDVLGLDWRVELDRVWRSIRYRAAVQGNLDSVALFAPLPELQRQTRYPAPGGRRPDISLI